jgi:hypothetical protein
MDGIDAIYIFTMTASVLAKGFAIVGAVGSVPVGDPVLLQCCLYVYRVVSYVVTAAVMLVYMIEPTGRYIQTLHRSKCASRSLRHLI